jgi:hypothetical protein
MNIDACVAMPSGKFRTVVDDRAVITCMPDTYITELARESCQALASMNNETLAPFAIEAYTLGGKKTREACKELYARMSQEIEDQWGVDTGAWDQSVGVLQCRSAPYHHDPFNPEVAYINWYVEGPPATFELNGKPTVLKPGNIVVFDPYCPHSLYYGRQYEFSADTAATANPLTSLFITLEVPMADVAYLLNVQRLSKPNAPLMGADGGVDPITGKWMADRQYFSDLLKSEEALNP